MNTHELLVIIFVAIIVFKPEHLPEVARLLGKTARRCKKVLGDMWNPVSFPRKRE